MKNFSINDKSRHKRKQHITDFHKNNAWKEECLVFTFFYSKIKQQSYQKSERLEKEKN